MNGLVWAVAVVAGVALEAVLPVSWTLGRTRAPVLLGVVAYYALNRGRGMMLAAALVGGLLRDAVAGLPLGCSASGLALVGGVLRAHRDLIFGRRLTTRLALGLVSGAAFSLAVYLALLAAAGLGLAVSAPEALDKALGEGVWSLAVLPLALAAMEGFDRMVGNVGAGAHDPG
jgi:rod shape-determining protein MreD